MDYSLCLTVVHIISSPTQTGLEQARLGEWKSGKTMLRGIRRACKIACTQGACMIPNVIRVCWTLVSSSFPAIRIIILSCVSMTPYCDVSTQFYCATSGIATPDSVIISTPCRREKEIRHYYYASAAWLMTNLCMSNAQQSYIECINLRYSRAYRMVFMYISFSFSFA